MRIGFDARAISYRGIGTYSRNLLRHFADSGVEVVVFCQDQEKDTMPAVDSFTLVSANMDPLVHAVARRVPLSGAEVQGGPPARAQPLGPDARSTPLWSPPSTTSLRFSTRAACR